MATHNVKQLEKDYCEYYEGDDDDVRSYIDDEDHFADVAFWIAKSLGYVNVVFSETQLSYYADDWTESECPAMGLKKPLVWQMDEDKSNMEYLIHAIVEAPNWSLGKDNKEAKQSKVMALCITGDSGDESVYSQIHPVGQCPECLYEHEIMIDKKVKVAITFYVRVKGKDKHQKFQQTFDDAINTMFTTANLEDGLSDEMYYEMDDEITIDSKLQRIVQTPVPKTRVI